MELKQAQKYGVLGLLMLLLGGGLGTFLPDEVDKMYYCPLTGDVGIFERFSSTMKTAYYTDPNTGDIVRVACRSGRTYEPWVKLTEYAKEQGIDISVLLNSHTKQTVVNNTKAHGNRVWRCDSEQCVEVRS